MIITEEKSEQGRLSRCHGTDLQTAWDEAKRHFDEVRKQYQDLEGVPGVNTSLALMFVFDCISRRYNSGERTSALFKEMMDVA